LVIARNGKWRAGRNPRHVLSLRQGAHGKEQLHIPAQGQDHRTRAAANIALKKLEY